MIKDSIISYLKQNGEASVRELFINIEKSTGSHTVISRHLKNLLEDGYVDRTLVNNGYDNKKYFKYFIKK